MFRSPLRAPACRRRPRPLPRAVGSALLALLLSAVPGLAQDGPDRALEARLRARLDGLDAETALYARHLPTGREVAVRADRVMNTLSVIKLAAMVRVYQHAEAGLLDLDARRTVTPDRVRGGSGLLQTFAPGLRPTVRDLVTQMIVTSDNTATDMVLEEVGLDDVNHMLDSLGYRETRFRMSTGEIFAAVDRRLDRAREEEGEAFVADRVIFDFEGDSTVWLGRSTPRETVRFLAAIHAGELASAEHSAEMVRILAGQLYASRLPRTMPRGVRIAHKTGDWPPHAGNDVGLLLYEGGPVAVAVYGNQNRGDFLELERAMGWIATELVEAWGGGG